LRAKLQSSNLIAQMMATIAGRGLCVLPLFMTAQQATLVRVLPAVVSLHRSFWLTIHADLRSLARIRMIADFLSLEVRKARKVFTQAND
jgi:DNA-binding transcriptional LysR family regulator